MIRRGSRLLVGAALLAVVAVSCSSSGGGSEQAAPSTTTRSVVATTTTFPPDEPLPPRQRSDFDHTYEVGRVQYTLVDESRPTDANGTYQGAPTRTLRTLVFYPAKGSPRLRAIPDAPPATEDAPYPLVVFSHGFSGAPEAYQGLLIELASAGYVVAAPAFPLTRLGAPGRPRLLDVRNQPADVSFVITQVLERSAGHTGPLAGMIDARRIGAAGHSLGAITTLMVTQNTCCADARIRAAVAMAGEAILAPAGGRYFARPGPPLLMLHGDADHLVAYRAGHKAFDEASPPKWFVTLLGADHSTGYMGAAPWFDVVTKTVVDFLDGELERRPGALDRIATDGTVSGVAKVEAVPS